MDFNSSRDIVDAPETPLIDYSNVDVNLKRQAKRDKRKVAGAVFYVALNVVLVYVIYEGLVMRGYL